LLGDARPPLQVRNGFRRLPRCPGPHANPLPATAPVAPYPSHPPLLLENLLVYHITQRAIWGVPNL
jgi:hypothetical protein